MPPALGHSPDICLPGHYPHNESSSQTESLSHLRSHPDRPPFGLKRMVSSSTGPSFRHSNGTTLTSRSAATTAFPSVSRQSPVASSDCVAPLKRFASQAGFSETVAGHLALCRRNSRLNGQARGGMFRKWCRVFHHRSSEPSIPKIAEFFTFLFTTEKTDVSTIKNYRAMLSSVFKFCLQEISSSLFSRTWCAPLRSQLLAHYIILLHGIWTRFWSTCQAPLLSLSRRFLSEWDQEGDVPRSYGYCHTCRGTAGSLTLSVSSGRWSGSPLWPVFSGIKQNRWKNPYQINHSLVSTRLVGDLPERVLCPVRTVRYLRWAARSIEFTPSRLFVSPLDPTRLCRRMLCRSSSDISSLRVGLCHLWFHRNPWHPRDCSFFELYSIFPFLPSQRQLHGRLLVCLPWDTLQTCLPPDHDLQVWVLWSLLALLSISIEWRESVFRTFLPILLWVYVWRFHLWAISLQIPSSPYPSLTFFAVDGLYCSM